MTTRRERRPPRVRFSLAHLFAATTLAAIALAATFGPRWDADERWIIGSWFVGTIGMAAIARARGKRGLLSAVLGGSILPGVAAVLSIALRDSASRTLAQEVAVIVFATVSGALLAALAVIGYERLLQVRRDGLRTSLAKFRTGWRPPPTWTGVPIGALLVLAWLATSATWHQRVTIEFYGSPEAAPQLPIASQAYYLDTNSSGSTPGIALTTGGSLLAAYGPVPYDWSRSVSSSSVSRFSIGNRQRLDLWETSWPWPRRAGTRWLEGFPQAIDFSPDGERLAITSGDSIALWDTLTGEETRTVRVPGIWFHSPYTPQLLDGRFTNDGTALIGRAWNSQTAEQLIFAWDAGSFALVREEARAGYGSLHVNHACTQFAHLRLRAKGSSEFDLNLIDSQSNSVVRRFDRLDAPFRPIYSPDDKLLAYGHRLWNLESGTERRFPGPIVQFASGGERVVVLNYQPQRDGIREWLGWIRVLPLVRHWTPDPFGLRSRLRLFDASSGRLLLTSQPQGLIQVVTVSRDGRVVATATDKGQIRIWDVPE